MLLVQKWGHQKIMCFFQANIMCRQRQVLKFVKLLNSTFVLKLWKWSVLGKCITNPFLIYPYFKYSNIIFAVLGIDSIYTSLGIYRITTNRTVHVVTCWKAEVIPRHVIYTLANSAIYLITLMKITGRWTQNPSNIYKGYFYIKLVR